MATRSYRVMLTVDISLDAYEEDWEHIESELEDAMEWDVNHSLDSCWVEEARIESFGVDY